MNGSVQHDFQSLLLLFRNTSYSLLIQGIDYDRNESLPPFIIVPKESPNNTHASYQPLVSDFYINNYQVKYAKTIRDNYYSNSKKIAGKYSIPLQGVSILGSMVQMHVRNTDGLTLDKITLKGTKLGGAILTKERCQDFQDVLTTLNVKYTRLDLGWVCIILLDDTNMAKASNKYQALLNKTTKPSRKIHLNAITLPTKVVHNKSQYIYNLWGARSSQRNISASNALAFVIYFPAIFVAKLLQYFLYNTYKATPQHTPENTPHNIRVSLIHTLAHLTGSAIALGGYYYLLIKGTRYLFDLTYTQSITQKYLYTTYQYLTNSNIHQYLNNVNLSQFGEMLNSYIVSAYVFLGSEVSLLHLSGNYWTISTLTAMLLLVGTIPMLRHVSSIVLGFVMIVALTLPAIILMQMALIHSASSTLQSMSMSMSMGMSMGMDATVAFTSTEGILGDLLTLGGSMLIASIVIPVLYVYLAFRISLRLARQYSPPRPTYDMPWLT